MTFNGTLWTLQQLIDIEKNLRLPAKIKDLWNSKTPEDRTLFKQIALLLAQSQGPDGDVAIAKLKKHPHYFPPAPAMTERFGYQLEFLRGVAESLKLTAFADLATMPDEQFRSVADLLTKHSQATEPTTHLDQLEHIYGIVNGTDEIIRQPKPDNGPPAPTNDIPYAPAINRDQAFRDVSEKNR